MNTDYFTVVCQIKKIATWLLKFLKQLIFQLKKMEF